MLKLNATLKFLGQVSDSYQSGSWCSFSVQDDLIMCQIFAANDCPEFQAGGSYPVTLELPYGDVYAGDIQLDQPIKLQVGGRILAKGVINEFVL